MYVLGLSTYPRKPGIVDDVSVTSHDISCPCIFDIFTEHQTIHGLLEMYNFTGDIHVHVHVYIPSTCVLVLATGTKYGAK